MALGVFLGICFRRSAPHVHFGKMCVLLFFVMFNCFIKLNSLTVKGKWQQKFSLSRLKETLK